MTTASSCPFCQLAAADIVAENAFHVVIRDRFPVSLGHSLLIPKRHVVSLFELTAEEFNALHELLHLTKQQLDTQHQPAGYNAASSYVVIVPTQMKNLTPTPLLDRRGAKKRDSFSPSPVKERGLGGEVLLEGCEQLRYVDYAHLV